MKRRRNPAATPAATISALQATADQPVEKLVFYDDEYYLRSGSQISSLYTEAGMRSDWGKVNVALREGRRVVIRAATPQEHAVMEQRCSAAIERLKSQGWSGPWDAGRNRTAPVIEVKPAAKPLPLRRVRGGRTLPPAANIERTAPPAFTSPRKSRKTGGAS